MASRWMLLAPWWARWLCNAAATAMLSTLFAALFFPEFPTTTAWPWKVTAMIGYGLACSATLLYAQQPLHDCYATRLRGLTPQQQKSAIAAVRRGDIPADPTVLSAAVRVGALSVTSLRRGAKQQKWSRWLVPLLYLIPGVWNLVDGDTRKGALWAGFALYFAVYLNVWSYRTRQVSDHVSQLRAAAVKVPEAAGVLAETAGGAHLPPRWQWQSLPLVVVSVAFFVVAGYFWGAPTLSHSSAHHQDCETVPQVYEFVNRHPEMLNAERIMPGDPGLPAYQEWANQLHTFAGSVHWSALAQHLDRVADLATHAVSVVNATRESPNPQASAHSHEADYQNTATAIVTEVGEAITVCRRDS